MKAPLLPGDLCVAITSIASGRPECGCIAPVRRESAAPFRYSSRMSRPVSVIGCTSCGALYTRAPGDGGLCPHCRQFAASELALDIDDKGRAPAAPKPVVPMPTLSGARRALPRKGRAVRRIAIGLGALLVAGIAALAVRSQAGAEAWTPTDAWTTVQRHTSAAMVAIRSHTPWPSPEAGKPGAEVTAREVSTRARGTHRKAKAGTKRAGN